MNLVILKKMAHAASDSAASGDLAASEELLGYLVENTELVRDLLGVRLDAGPALREHWKKLPIARLPAEMLRMIEEVRKGARLAKHDAKDAETSRLSVEIAATALRVSPTEWLLEGEPLARLAKLRTRDSVFLDLGPGPKGDPRGVLLPLGPIRKLAALKKPTEWLVKMAIKDGERFIGPRRANGMDPEWLKRPAGMVELRWSKTGGLRSGEFREALYGNDDNAAWVSLEKSEPLTIVTKEAA